MITLPQSQFQKAAQFAASVVGRRATIPVLTTMKVTANGRLSFAGTDLDMMARATLDYDGDEGEFLVPEPSKVLAAVKKAGAETVALEQRDKVLRVEAGELISDMTGSIPADDFPTFDPVAYEAFGATVGEDFFRALDRVRPAISTEETRYYLNGVHFHKVGDWLYRLVATDGHRLFMADIALPEAKGDLPDSLIISRRAVERAISTFAKTRDGVRMSLGSAVKANRKEKTLAPTNSISRVTFAGPSGDIHFELSSKLIDGTYPDYTRVVPAENSFAIRMKLSELAKAVKSLTPLSTGKTRAIRISAQEGRVEVELHSPDIGKSRFPVAAEHKAPKDFYIGLNARYLLDALNALTGDEVEFGLTDAGAPMTITDPADTAFKIVQMPMRV